MAGDSSSLDSWQLQWDDSNRRFYRNLVESEREFYRDMNDLRISCGMPPVTHSCDSVVNRAYERTLLVKAHDKTSAMAEGTRMKPLDESVKKVEVQIQQMQLLMVSMNSTRSFTTESNQQAEEQAQSDDDAPSFQEEIETPTQEIEALSQEIESNEQFAENPKEMQIRFKFLNHREDNEVLAPADVDEYTEYPKVISNPIETSISDWVFRKMGESCDILIASSKIREPDFRWIPIDCLETPTVQQLLVEWPIKMVENAEVLVDIIGTKSAHKVFEEMHHQDAFVFTGLVDRNHPRSAMVFDPGGMYAAPMKRRKQCTVESSGVTGIIDAYRVLLGCILIFDPGGELAWIFDPG